jgi:hypothetical protein
MPRKITSGRVGSAVLGNLTTSANAFESVEANANIVFTPDGTGVTEFTKDVYTSSNAGIRFGDNDTNYAKIVAPSGLSANYTLTLPTDDGAASQALTTDGNGVLSWASPGLTVTNRTSADSNTYYIAMVDQTSGSESTLSIASDRFSFVPNPGRLTVNSFVCNSVDIGGGAIDGTPIGATSASTGAFSTLTATSITETSSIALKENIQPIDNGLGSILKLVGVTYDRKDGSTENEAGLIAEDVNNVLPNLVTKDNNGNPLGINYTKLSAYLIEAVKSLSTEIDYLKGKINNG